MKKAILEDLFQPFTHVGGSEWGGGGGGLHVGCRLNVDCVKGLNGMS